MSKPQFVLEEALESYLSQLTNSARDYSKVCDSIIDFSTGLLIGLKAANGKILATEELDANTDKD